MSAKAVVVLSGGMDSTTLLYHVLARGYQTQAVSFNYGQRHIRELDAAAAICQRNHVPHAIVDLRSLTTLLQSALTGTADVPHGYYAEDSMRKTVVPGRNAIMLSIAWGIAASADAEIVATGIHAGDHFIYPDCRPEFAAALDAALILGTLGHAHTELRLYTPYLHVTKVDIAQEGAKLGVPYEATWTCYEGGAVHCGVCGACQERRAGFRDAGVPDPTVYADLTEYQTP